MQELARMCRHPGVHGSNRLLEQREVRQSSSSRRIHRQLACLLVKRGRHGQDDGLFFEAQPRITGSLDVIPCVAQVHQHVRCRVDGGDPQRVRCPGQQRGAPIDRPIGQPGLG